MKEERTRNYLHYVCQMTARIGKKFWNLKLRIQDPLKYWENIGMICIQTIWFINKFMKRPSLSLINQENVHLKPQRDTFSIMRDIFSIMTKIIKVNNMKHWHEYEKPDVYRLLMGTHMHSGVHTHTHRNCEKRLKLEIVHRCRPKEGQSQTWTPKASHMNKLFQFWECKVSRWTRQTSC